MASYALNGEPTGLRARRFPRRRRRVNSPERPGTTNVVETFISSKSTVSIAFRTRRVRTAEWKSKATIARLIQHVTVCWKKERTQICTRSFSGRPGPRANGNRTDWPIWVHSLRVRVRVGGRVCRSFAHDYINSWYSRPSRAKRIEGTAAHCNAVSRGIRTNESFFLLWKRPVSSPYWSLRFKLLSPHLLGIVLAAFRFEVNSGDGIVLNDAHFNHRSSRDVFRRVAFYHFPGDRMIGVGEKYVESNQNEFFSVIKHVVGSVLNNSSELQN